eukprot:gnl/TRDRNA2_/TRDRNA2_168217_c1_seq1.p1 gnl/TRDRNA2_/TRDRNA2_168217_c1~~gnl/TRDRNA2_/TRDRNA2_168217_c1_seq1.p1  ORF type:complete len:113 (-),score=16.82 gnl/TRDRNA2_/TRDRNA2_168217_c1_seq1:287-625(-)
MEDIGHHPPEFRVVKVVNGFHKSQHQRIFPATASVLVIACISTFDAKTHDKSLQVLVEVELLLGDKTHEARWIAELLEIRPEVRPPTPPPEKFIAVTKSTKRKQPPHTIGGM